MRFAIILKGLTPVSLTVYYLLSIRQRFWEAIVWVQSLNVRPNQNEVIYTKSHLLKLNFETKQFSNQKGYNLAKPTRKENLISIL